MHYEIKLFTFSKFCYGIPQDRWIVDDMGQLTCYRCGEFVQKTEIPNKIVRYKLNWLN